MHISTNTMPSSTVRIKEFCYTGPGGGTRLSNSPHDPSYPFPFALVQVQRMFLDYECGWRLIGEAADPQLQAFRDQHGCPMDRRIFFSEFDLADRRDLGPLIDRFGSTFQEMMVLSE